jgi:hypothetical protein
VSRPLNRIVPKAPARAFKTYGMHVTEREPVSCEVAECARWLTGWATVVLANSQDEQTIEAACRGEIDGIRRRWESATVQSDGFVRYVFPPGQPCFRASTHSIPVTARYTLRDGDWRGNPSGRRVVTDSARAWLDDFGEHQQRIVDQRRALGAE